MFVGNMSKKDWDRVGHFCKECDEAYAQPLLMNRAATKKELGIHTA